MYYIRPIKRTVRLKNFFLMSTEETGMKFKEGTESELPDIYYTFTCGQKDTRTLLSIFCHH